MVHSLLLQAELQPAPGRHRTVGDGDSVDSTVAREDNSALGIRVRAGVQPLQHSLVENWEPAELVAKNGISDTQTRLDKN